MTKWNDLEQIRLEKLERLRQAGMEPYPNHVERTQTTADAIRAFEAAGEDEIIEVTVVGRLRSIRTMGKSTFAHIEDGAGRLQLYLRADELGAEAFDLFNSDFDLGDFIQIQGRMFRTRTGEATLRVADYRMLAKGITPLPATKEEEVDGERVVHSAFSDPEALPGTLR
jgi:lysyl-tRNA synthetase class 2